MRSELDEADDSDYRPRVALTSPTGRVNGFEDSLVDRIPRSQEPVSMGEIPKSDGGFRSIPESVSSPDQPPRSFYQESDRPVN